MCWLVVGHCANDVPWAESRFGVISIPVKWSGAKLTQAAGDTVFLCLCLLRTRCGVERIYIHIPDRRAMTIETGHRRDVEDIRFTVSSKSLSGVLKNPKCLNVFHS